MGDAKGRLGFVEQNLQTLEDHVLGELESLKKAVTGQDELRTRFMELFANLQEQLDVVKVGVEKTRQETAMCKRAITGGAEFTTLMLHIPNMTEEDLLFNFIDGLKNWAKQELQRRGVKDIDEAITVTESLMEYARVSDSTKGNNAQMASPGNHAKGGGDKPKAWNKGNNQAGTSKSEGHGKLEERRAKSKPKDGCFFCGGPHWARDCPRQGKLNALVEENEEPDNGAVHMGSLQILNALHAKVVAKVPTGEGQASMGNGLFYVEAKLNGKPAQVMVDTGATHNFVTMEEAKRLGLKVVGGGGWLKSVNTDVKPLQGAARQVEMCLGSWRGLVDFSVASIYDFKVVIGLDFLRQVNALVSPYSNAVHIMEKRVSCVVPTSMGTSSAKTLASMQLTVMQIVKGVKKGETTYLAALKMEDHVGDSTDPLPREIEEVLEENKDMMPTLIPKQARWQDFLAEFDYVMEYKSSQDNLVANALSRKAKLAAMSKAKGDILEGIKEGMEHDPLARKLLKLAESGQTQRFWVEDDLLYTKGQRVSWIEQTDMARSYLDKAARKIKKWADKRRRPKEYNLGDMVMLKLLPQQFKSLRKVHKGSESTKDPFPSRKKLGKYHIDWSYCQG
ncbi:hypothetical protein RJ640_000529 [Escallonia rubra]|uniref:Uncharacterized protein n=1 Tax=Escallonia rubra TaxID=112253 RepID=A0AA88U5X9_9ASTE|nr:hypothetical protein RJ640_000529 [Escallonia rubra]